jgi:uncharacterized protein (TIGR03086 family)
MTDPNPIDMLSRALEQTGQIISRIRPNQAGLPTPCRSWDVRVLVNHVVHDLKHFTASASGGRRDQQDGDLIGDDWSGAYREAADALLAAWRAGGALDRLVDLPFGQVPATWLLGQHLADVVVHGWDLARATGQSTDLDPELGQQALDWGRENLRPEYRGDEESGKSFGVEVPVQDDAPLHDRLAGVFGRDPGDPRLASGKDVAGHTT